MYSHHVNPIKSSLCSQVLYKSGLRITLQGFIFEISPILENVHGDMYPHYENPTDVYTETMYKNFFMQDERNIKKCNCMMTDTQKWSFQSSSF